MSCGSPKFFKVIQNHELQNGELRVPKNFVQKYWKGGSCFKVEIFGLNCLEIDYSKFVDQVKSEAEFVEVTEPKISRSKFVDETNIAGTSQRRKRGTKRGHHPNQNTPKQKQHHPTSGKKTKTGRQPPFHLVSRTASPRLLLHQPQHSLPPSLPPPTPHATGYLFRIPCDFSRPYLKDFEGFARIRKLGDDRSWKIEVKYERKGDYSVVKSGWNPFAMEYNLKAGDIFLTSSKGWLEWLKELLLESLVFEV
ncbi:hypothetical protein P8452_01228 [Trifolium repens]|nr:hypothetical protein P8452_01228 [Trifolium repens]